MLETIAGLFWFGYIFLILFIMFLAEDKVINTFLVVIGCLIFTPFLMAIAVLNSKHKSTAQFEKEFKEFMTNYKQ